MKRVIYASRALLLSGEQGTTSDTKLVSKNTAPFKANATMKLQEFWRVIDYAKQQADGDEGAQEKLLVETLAQYSPDEIIEQDLRTWAFYPQFQPRKAVFGMSTCESRSS